VAPQSYGSSGKYGYQNNIDAINQGYLYRSRSKDAVGLQNNLKSNRYGGAASVIAEGRMES
jgi:hypothetical protein